MLAVLALSGLASATTTPELELCRAAAAGDLAGTRAAIAAGASVTAAGQVPLDAAPSASDAERWAYLSRVLTTGVAPLLPPQPARVRLAPYHALTCALSAPKPSWAVVDALLQAGATPDRPVRGAAIATFLATHLDDPAAAEGYRWLRARGADPVNAARALVVDGRATLASFALLDAVLADGAVSPACEAAARGDLAVLAHVVTRPDAVTCPAAGPSTLLGVAASAGQLQAVAWLTAHGADPNFTPTAASALAYAVLAGHLAVVRELLANGADPLAAASAQASALDALDATPAFTAALLDALRPGEAVAWALARAFRDDGAYAAVRRAMGVDTPSPLQARSPGALAAAAWLSGKDPQLVPWLDADVAARPLVTALTARFWSDALAGATLPDVIAVLRLEPAGKEADLLLSHNACLPQKDERRGAVRKRLGRPFAFEPAADSFLPGPEGDAAIRVVYLDGAVSRVRVSRPADVRAAGCDAPALRYLELPAWQRAWEYGATAEQLARYNMPDAQLERVAWALDGALSLTDLSADER